MSRNANKTTTHSTSSVIRVFQNETIVVWFHKCNTSPLCIICTIPLLKCCSCVTALWLRSLNAFRQLYVLVATHSKRKVLCNVSTLQSKQYGYQFDVLLLLLRNEYESEMNNSEKQNAIIWFQVRISVFRICQDLVFWRQLKQKYCC